MDPLAVIAIALAVFAAFVLVTAYILRSAKMFRSVGSESCKAGKIDTGQNVNEEAEGSDKRKSKGNSRPMRKK